MTVDSALKPNMVLVPDGKYLVADAPDGSRLVLVRVADSEEKYDLIIHPGGRLFAVYGRKKDALTVEKILH